ncbi:MAG: hypothetical protein M3419_11330 [Actinomycetota bacterium]|nr:hypothetical protein [Actinomycetota bacterium]
MQRLYLHVGPPKSGTSYLQSAMWRSRPALRQQGLVLAMRRRADHFHLMLAVTDQAVADADPPEAFSALDRLEKFLARSDAGRILLSHESLAAASRDQAERLLGLLGDVEVHLVLTARDLARQVPSGWQQRVQARETIRFEEFADAVVAAQGVGGAFWAHHDLLDVADRWGRQLQPEQVHVVTVPPPGSPSGLLLGRWCSVLGLDPATLDTAGATGNPSLGRVQAEVLRRVNAAIGDDLPRVRGRYGRVPRDLLPRQVLGVQPGVPTQLPRRLHQWCEDRSRATVQGLRARGYDVVGDLADLLPGSQSAAGLPVTEEEVAAAATQALARMLVLRDAELAQPLDPTIGHSDAHE